MLYEVITYTFGGWYDNAGFTGSAVTEISTTDIGLKELFAKWTANTYNITYNLNGGTNNGTNSATYTYATGLTLSSPTKTGYTFGGWYDNSGFTGSAVTEISTTYTGAIELFAKWTANTYNITYNLNGGTNNSANSATYTYGTGLTLLSPTKTGYTFGGWYDNAGFTGSAVTEIRTTDTGVKELFAKWTKTIEIVESPAGIANPDLIKIEQNGDAFNQSVEVKLKKDSAVEEAIKNALDDVIKQDLTDATVFPLDISLYVKGTDTKVQPNEGTSVTITCPIPESILSNKDKIKVVCLIDNKLTILPTTILQIDGVWCVQFTASHFSPYAMVVDTTNTSYNFV